MTRPRVLVALPGVFASTVINVAKPLLALHASGSIDLDVSLHSVVRRAQVERADVLVMSHTIAPAHAWILDCAQRAGTPLLYDIDENLFEPPPDVPGLQFHADPARQATVRQCLEQAALVRTYSPVLKRYLNRFNPNVVRVDGPVDWSLIPDHPAPGTWHPASGTTENLHIVYATSRIDDSIGVPLVGPLRRVLADHPNVDVTIWGPRLPGLNHPRVRHRPFIRDYDRYFSEFARAGFDIGLAPMPADLFHQCKTATKFREYAACRIAGIYSDVDMYRDCIVDGETGLLVGSNDDDWVAAMGRLIEDAALRHRIQEGGQAYARERYSPGRIESVWLGQIRDVGRNKSRKWGSAFAGPSGATSPASFGLIVGVSQELWRHAARIAALLRSRGIVGILKRTRRQIADLHQLIVWQRALRRSTPR